MTGLGFLQNRAPVTSRKDVNPNLDPYPVDGKELTEEENDENGGGNDVESQKLPKKILSNTSMAGVDDTLYRTGTVSIEKYNNLKDKISKLAKHYVLGHIFRKLQKILKKYAMRNNLYIILYIFEILCCMIKTIELFPFLGDKAILSLVMFP